MVRKGFTLIELLVVIAIISLLLAVLVPVLKSSKEQARTIQCSSNIRQLTMAMNMYEMDNRTYPYSFLLVSIMSKYENDLCSGKDNNIGQWWLNYIEGYLGDFRGSYDIFKCPLKKTPDLNLKKNLLCGNYGVNLSICKYKTGHLSEPEFRGKPLSVSSLKNPSKTLLLVDSGYATISFRKVIDKKNLEEETTEEKTLEACSYVPGLSINKDREIWSGLESDAIKGRHYNKKVNAGFPDGHIEKMAAKKLLVEKIDGKYKNSPLWVP